MTDDGGVDSGGNDGEPQKWAGLGFFIIIIIIITLLIEPTGLMIA